MSKLIALCAFAVAFAAPELAAQTSRADEVVIQFEIQKNGTTVAQPTIRMHLGGEATVASDTVPHFTVVPTQPDAQHYILDLEFALPNARPILRLRLTGQEPRTATLTVGNDSFEIKASARQPS